MVFPYRCETTTSQRWMSPASSKPRPSSTTRVVQMSSFLHSLDPSQLTCTFMSFGGLWIDHLCSLADYEYTICVLWLTMRPFKFFGWLWIDHFCSFVDYEQTIRVLWVTMTWPWIHPTFERRPMLIMRTCGVTEKLVWFWVIDYPIGNRRETLTQWQCKCGSWNVRLPNRCPGERKYSDTSWGHVVFHAYGPRALLEVTIFYRFPLHDIPFCKSFVYVREVKWFSQHTIRTMRSTAPMFDFSKFPHP